VNQITFTSGIRWIFRVGVLLGLLSLGACATRLGPAVDADGTPMPAELILGNESQILATLGNAAQQQFPSSTVQRLPLPDKGFQWSHRPLLDQTTFSLKLLKGSGHDAKNTVVQGYYFTVDTWGTDLFVQTNYVNPLAALIKIKLQAIGATIVSVDAIQATDLSTELKDLATQSQACFASLTTDPELQAIRNKVALGPTVDPAFPVFTDVARVAYQDKAAMFAWGKKRDKCIALMRKSHATTEIDPAVAKALESAEVAVQALIAKLYSGTMTYGEFAARRYSVMDETRAAIARMQP